MMRDRSTYDAAFLIGPIVHKLTQAHFNFETPMLHLQGSMRADG
jgi:hypothetical protein